MATQRIVTIGAILDRGTADSMTTGAALTGGVGELYRIGLPRTDTRIVGESIRGTISVATAVLTGHTGVRRLRTSITQRVEFLFPVPLLRSTQIGILSRGADRICQIFYQEV